MASCIPPGDGVPGLSGPPQWWQDPGPPDRPYNDEIDDPRWVGAVRHSYGTGASEDARFRAVYAGEDLDPGPVSNYNPVLYLSWRVLHDASNSPGSDGIYVGFQRQGGPRYLIRVFAYNGTDQTADEPAERAVMSLDGAGQATDLVKQPTWLDQTKSWLAGPTMTNTNYRWAIAMRVPTTGFGPDVSDLGINLGYLSGGATFNFWYVVIKDQGKFATPYYWPRDSPKIAGDSLQNKYPTSGWDSVSLGRAACGQGVSLESLNVGTKNFVNGMPARSKILISTTMDTTNTLFAKPANTGPEILPEQLAATFRTANWGSQGLWENAPGATPWQEIDPAVANRNDKVIPGGEITHSWTIKAADAGDWIPPGGNKSKHQCILVTLSGPFDFINDSVYANMDFKQASEFELPAQISIEGLEPRKQSMRVVYLYVERDNMPRTLDKPQAPADVRRVLAELGIGQEGKDVKPGTSSPGNSSPITVDDLAERVPTVRFHVYHETGDVIVVGDKMVKPVAEEQTAFGYFIQHTGAVYGWDVVLGGEFKKIADNLFRLEIPEGSKTIINTKVRALEGQPGKERPEIEPGPKQPGKGRQSGKE